LWVVSLYSAQYVPVTISNKHTRNVSLLLNFFISMMLLPILTSQPPSQPHLLRKFVVESLILRSSGSHLFLSLQSPLEAILKRCTFIEFFLHHSSTWNTVKDSRLTSMENLKYKEKSIKLNKNNKLQWTQCTKYQAPAGKVCTVTDACNLLACWMLKVTEEINKTQPG
jgi:hypothetical protein